MRLTMLAAAASAAVALGGGGAALAQSIEITDVPRTVMAVARQAAPGAEFTKAGIDVQADTLTPVYEITGSMGGKQIEVDVTPQGEVDEVERQVEMSAVPEAVQATLKAYLPQFQPTMVEHSMRMRGQAFYEFEGQHDGRAIDVEISERGDIIMINDDRAA